MPVPVVVTIPHKLGKEEATRRLEAGFRGVRKGVGGTFAVLKDEWKGNHLDFSASLLGQTTNGTVDVAHDHGAQMNVGEMGESEQLRRGFTGA